MNPKALAKFAEAVEHFVNLAHVESTDQVEDIFRGAFAEERRNRLMTIRPQDAWAYKQHHRALREFLKKWSAIDPAQRNLAEKTRAKLRNVVDRRIGKHSFSGHYERDARCQLRFVPEETRSIEAIIYIVLAALLEKGTGSRARQCDVEACPHFVIDIRAEGKRGRPRTTCKPCAESAQDRYNRTFRAKGKK